MSATATMLRSTADRTDRDLIEVLHRYAADPTAWPMAPRFSPFGRWSAKLGGTDTYEVWLRTWMPGQGTDPHHHDLETTAFVVVSGVLTELVGPRSADGHPDDGHASAHPATLCSGDVRVLRPGLSHQIHNRHADLAVSVHVQTRGPATGTDVPAVRPAQLTTAGTQRNRD